MRPPETFFDTPVFGAFWNLLVQAYFQSNQNVHRDRIIEAVGKADVVWTYNPMQYVGALATVMNKKLVAGGQPFRIRPGTERRSFALVRVN